MAALATTRVATPVISELRRAWLSCMERTILFRRGAVRAWVAVGACRPRAGRRRGRRASHGTRSGERPVVAYGTAVVCVPTPAKVRGGGSCAAGGPAALPGDGPFLAERGTGGKGAGYYGR